LWKLALRLDGCRKLAFGNRNRRPTYPTEGPNTEEALPAGIASVCGQAQKAFGKQQDAPLDPVPRNAFEVEVSAPRAMREARVRDRHAARVEAEFAALAAPGAESAEREEKIRDAAPVRSKAISAAAPWTNHGHTPDNCAPAYRKQNRSASAAGAQLRLGFHHSV
jgi:hypothetical protein